LSVIRRFPPFNGIDLSKTEVMRNEQSLSDALNMKFDLTGRYVKRGGFEEPTWGNNLDASFIRNSLHKRYGIISFDGYESDRGIFTGKAVYFGGEQLKGDESQTPDMISLSPNIANGTVYKLDKNLPSAAQRYCTSANVVNDLKDLSTQSSICLGGNLYMTSSSGDIYKFDGQSVSLAGLQVEATSLSLTNAANPVAPDDRQDHGIFASTYYYKFRLKRVDSQMNITYSKFSGSPSATLVGAEFSKIGVDLSSSDFGDRQVNYGTVKTTTTYAPASTLTIPMIDGFTLKVGDLVPLKLYGVSNAKQDKIIYTKIKSIITTGGAGSITVDTELINTVAITGTLEVYKDENLTNGLTYEVYRTKVGGTILGTYYRNAEFNSIKVNSSQAIAYEYDSLNDADLVEILDEAVNPSTGKLPAGRRLGKHQDSLIILGVDGKTIHWSAPSNYEVFPVGNSAIIGSDDEGFIQGFKSNNNGLIVIKDRAVYYIHGSLFDGNVEVRKAPSNVGGSSHHSMIEISGSALFLGDQGIFAASLGAVPVEAGKPINKKLIELKSVLNFSLAVATDWRKERLYVLSIPYQSSVTLVPVDPFTVVYDYFNGGWFFWDSLDISGGAIEDGSDFIFTPEKRPDTEVNKSKPMIYLPTTYKDMTKAINAKLVTAWEHAGAPGFEKKFQMLKIFSVSTDEFVMSVKTDEEYLAVDEPITNYEELEFIEGNASRILPVKDGHTEALRITFENNNSGEALTIDGWELEHEVVSDRLKE